MTTINISANGNSEAIAVPIRHMVELRLRATSIDAGFTGTIQRADIGQSNWRDIYIDATVQMFTPTILEFFGVGNAQYRIVVAGIGTSEAMTFSIDEVFVSLTDASVAEIAGEAGIGTDTARSIVITVTDVSDDSLISGARISVLNNAGVATGQVVTTSALGTATVTLDDGAYKFRVLAPTGYVSPSDISVTVDSDADPVAIELTANDPVASTDPEMCIIQCRVFNAAGVAVQDAVVSASPVSSAASVDQIILAKIQASATTNASGYCELVLPRQTQMTNSGSKAYRFTVTNGGTEVFQKFNALIPDANSAWLEDLLNG